MYGDGLRLKYPKLYKFWQSIRYACNNENSISYKNCGAIGIKVCEEWNNYENFMNWAIQNGWDNNKCINRINLNSNFEPNNCTVDNTRIYNTKNMRNNIKYNDRLYRLWLGMKRRCYNKKLKEYKDYGGRGIVVCNEWLNSFESFRSWAQQNGYNDNLTIDRIDVNGNYEPSNCKWATRKEQSNNRRNNHYIEHKGEKYTLTQLAEKFNINVNTLYTRLYVYPFWDLERALTTPVKIANKK